MGSLTPNARALPNPGAPGAAESAPGSFLAVETRAYRPARSPDLAFPLPLPRLWQVPAAAAAARVGWGEVCEPRGAAPRLAGARPSLLFTRWPLRPLGRARGDSRAGAAAARTSWPRRPLASHGHHWESCRRARWSGGPGAAHGEWADFGGGWGGAWGEAVWASPGGACELRNRRTPFIESGSGGATPAAQRGHLPAPEHLPFRALLPPSLPLRSLPGQGSSRRVLPPRLHFPVSAPPDPGTQVRHFRPRAGMRASCPCLHPLPSLGRSPRIRPTLSPGDASRIAAPLPRLQPPPPTPAGQG